PTRRPSCARARSREEPSQAACNWPRAPGSKRVSGPRVLLLEHERSAPAGFIDDWLEGHDADVHLVRIDEADERDAPHEDDLIVALGSECSVRDEHVPWIARELELLRAAAAADVPVLGICFGGQLLARALG